MSEYDKDDYNFLLGFILLEVYVTETVDKFTCNI